MSELPELPPAEPRRRPLPDGGLERAVAAGGRRRTRFLAGAGAGSVLSLVLLAGLVSSGPARDDSLQFAPPGEVTSEEPAEPGQPSAAPEPTPPVASAGADPEGSGAPAPVASAEPGPEGQPAPESSVRPAPAPAPVPVSERPPFREQTDEDADGDPACRPTKASTGGCTYGGGDNGPLVARGTPITAYVGGSCSGQSSTNDNVFLYDGGQETELVVRQGGDEVFRFSATVRYVEGAHERRLRPGRCIEWRQTWNAVTTAGEPVPAGTYQVAMTMTTQRERSESEFDDVDYPGQTREHLFDVTIVD